MDYVAGKNIHLDENGDVHTDWKRPILYRNLKKGFEHYYGYDYIFKKDKTTSCYSQPTSHFLLMTGIRSEVKSAGESRVCHISFEEDEKFTDRYNRGGLFSYAHKKHSNHELIGFSYEEIETEKGMRAMIRKTSCLRDGVAQRIVVTIRSRVGYPKESYGDNFIHHIFITNQPCDTPAE